MKTNLNSFIANTWTLKGYFIFYHYLRSDTSYNHVLSVPTTTTYWLIIVKYKAIIFQSFKTRRISHLLSHQPFFTNTTKLQTLNRTPNLFKTHSRFFFYTCLVFTKSFIWIMYIKTYTNTTKGLTKKHIINTRI